MGTEERKAQPGTARNEGNGSMTTAFILAACITGVLSLMALLGYSAMTRSAKANPDHWQHD
jgi:hypothetical protein